MNENEKVIVEKYGQVKVIFNYSYNGYWRYYSKEEDFVIKGLGLVSGEFRRVMRVYELADQFVSFGLITD